MSFASRIFICLFILLTSFESYASTSISSDIYNDIISNLKDHINGDMVLSDSDFEDNHDLLLENMPVLATDSESIINSFELISLFEETIGALFTTSNTQNGFNRAYSSDGRNLHRNIMLIYQGLIDYSYTSEWLASNPDIFDGNLFLSSNYFPGFVDGPEDTEAMETATVKCSYLLAKGSQPWGEIGNPNVVRPTGCYLAPGSIAEISVPESIVGKGVKIRVGAHYWNLENKGNYKRMDRVSITFDVNEATLKIANPLGGGIYLEVPLGVDEGLIDITFKNVVRSPFFSMKTFHETTLTEWMEVERNHAAPWTDFETDKFMMQVPTSWIYNFDDPKTLLEEWDKSMDAVSDLLGRPRIADRHKNYLQFDVIIRGSAYHPGYPMSNTPYNPNSATDGTPQHNILKGPQYGQDIHFHELGHEVAITKFVGETEAIVNFLYVPVLNKCFGFSLDEAFQKSFGPSYNYFSTKDNTTKTRLVAETFHEGIPRNTCSCTKNEVRYQHRGYAHYVDIVELYGWEALEKFFESESEAADMGNPFPVNNQPQDDRIFRMSKAAGVDLRPLFHFWGIHPNDQDALAMLMEENGLKLPMDIKQKLHQYRTLIPSNYDEFVAFANELHPDFLNYSGTQFDFGSGWYQATAEIYDEDRAAEIEQALSDIIILYYGTDCFDQEEFLDADFSFETQYCKSNEVNLLPTTSDNNIDGTWFPEEVNTTEVGEFEYTFTPNLDECALEKNEMVEIYEITATIFGGLINCYGDATTLFTIQNYTSYEWAFEGQVISDLATVEVSEGGTYSLAVTDFNGCLAEAEIDVIEKDPIDINIEIIEPLCFGEYGAAIFEPVGGPDIEYTYSIAGDSLYGSIYTVIVFDSLGCNESFDFEVTQPDLIVIELIDDELVITGGVEPYDVTIDTMGNVLNVSVVDGNECNASMEFMVTSVQEENVQKISVFPNPALDKIYLNLEGASSSVASLELVALDGRVVRKFSNKALVLDVSQMHNGVHILRVLFEDGTRENIKVMLLK